MNADTLKSGSALEKILAAGQFAVTGEIGPPKSHDAEVIREKCSLLKGYVDAANIRKGPGTNYQKKYLTPVIKYDSFKVLKRKGQWVKVMDEFGDNGWIFRKLLWIY